MKKLITLFIPLLLCSSIRANGWTAWGLIEQEPQRAVTARVGYQFFNIEPFVGSTWRPDYNVEAGEIKPPQVLSIGCFYHFQDLLDPNDPLPWISPLLLTFIPEEFVAQPYFGPQCTWNFIDKDAGFYGVAIGLQMKANPEDDNACLVAEIAYNDNFGDLSAVEEEVRLHLGFRFKLP